VAKPRIKIGLQEQRNASLQQQRISKDKIKIYKIPVSETQLIADLHKKFT
jgi:hypothetical protein